MKVWEATYTPFGGVHTSAGNLPANRFPGQWFQSESGLHQNWMRDYDPTTGRYLEPDPLGLVDGASVYGYVGQSPMNFIDPRGEAAQSVAICAVVPEVCVGVLIVGAAWATYQLILACPNDLDFGFHLPPWFQSEADDGKEVPPSPGPYTGETPDDKPGDYTRHGPSGGLKGPDGSIWEKDRTKHEGTTWKRWPNEKSWEKDRGRESIRPNGSVRG